MQLRPACFSRLRLQTPSVSSTAKVFSLTCGGFHEALFGKRFLASKSFDGRWQMVAETAPTPRGSKGCSPEPLPSPLEGRMNDPHTGYQPRLARGLFGVGGSLRFLQAAPSAATVHMRALRGLLGTPVQWAAVLPLCPGAPALAVPLPTLPLHCFPASARHQSGRVWRTAHRPRVCPVDVPSLSKPSFYLGRSSRGDPRVQAMLSPRGPFFSGLSTSFTRTCLGPVGDADLPSDLRPSGPHLVSGAAPCCS